jgi:3-oxoacyl-[acyl-carrier protein] reductase
MTRGLRALPDRVAAALRWWAACVDGAVPALSRAGGGEIVSVVSSAGRYRAAYFEPDGDAASAALAAAVDSAILGLTRQLAVELAPRKIRVNAIAMGWIRTASSPFGATPPTDEDRALVLEEIPLGRPGEPDEVAAAIAFLASDASRYLTGEVLDVNGGWWMS